MRIVVLGAAAGGGVPQWNCNAPISAGVREGRIVSPCRTQASIAVSLDRERWVLINASPDLRQQFLEQRCLWPRPGRLRDTPVQAVLLTGAEIDNVAGLLTMRERQAFSLWATGRVLAMLDENPIFAALDRAIVPRRPLPLDRIVALTGPEGELGIAVRAFAVPGKLPLYLEKRSPGDLAGAPEDSIGLEDLGRRQDLPLHPGLRQPDAGNTGQDRVAPACCSSTALSGATMRWWPLARDRRPAAAWGI